MRPDDVANRDGAPPQGFELHQDPFGRLVLVTPDGARHVGVEPVRSFPISDPGRWVSFCDPDGREVVCLESLDVLPAAARKLVEDELAFREFVPVIRRIIKVSGEGVPSDWTVATNRGGTTFTLENEEDLRRIGDHRILVTDSRKQRYQVPDVRALDHPSRRILDRYL